MKFYETGQYAEPITIEMCFSDPGYADCSEAKPQDINLHNAALNLQKIRTLVNKLDQETYPPELARVVVYLRRFQLFLLWSETQKLEFIKTGQIAALTSTFHNLDPETACDDVLDRQTGSECSCCGLVCRFLCYRVL